jgi:cytochrome c peroxidase
MSGPESQRKPLRWRSARRRCGDRTASILKLLIVLAASAAFGAALADELSPLQSYQWHVPPGFPRPAVPADNPMSEAKVELGRRLFFEFRLSSTGKYSCASCHRPELAFTDGRARAQGATGDAVRRAAMSLANVAYNPAFTWGNSSVRTLEAQMRQPLFSEHPLEMGLKGGGRIAVTALSHDESYRSQFAAAFPAEPAALTMPHIIMAIAAFERTLISGRSPFDRYIFDDDTTALSEPAKRGMTLFFSAQIGCAQCHSGLNFSGPLVYEGHAKDSALFVNTGLYDIDGRGGYPATDRGLIEVTHRGQDMGKFRVPTLRNIALTAPYMHDGSLSSLDDVLDHYTRGGHKSPRQDPRVRAFALAPSQRADLKEFLSSLTDREFVENPYLPP